jgi:hypothetical protein
VGAVEEGVATVLDIEKTKRDSLSQYVDYQGVYILLTKVEGPDDRSGWKSRKFRKGQMMTPPENLLPD